MCQVLNTAWMVLLKKGATGHTLCQQGLHTRFLSLVAAVQELIPTCRGNCWRSLEKKMPPATWCWHGLQTLMPPATRCRCGLQTMVPPATWCRRGLWTRVLLLSAAIEELTPNCWGN